MEKSRYLYEGSTYTGNLTALLMLIIPKLDGLEGTEFPEMWHGWLLNPSRCSYVK